MLNPLDFAFFGGKHLRTFEETIVSIYRLLEAP